MKNRWTYFFLFSLFLAYGADWAPYYLSLFSSGKLRVIGPLNWFQEPCADEPRGSKACKVQYRIPNGILRSRNAHDKLGLGIIIQPTEIACQNYSANSISLGTVYEEARVMTYFNHYQSISLDEINCSGDIIVKNWVEAGKFKRYGYSSGPAVVGPADWVEQVSALVQFFQGQLSVIFAIVFFLFYLGSQSLQKLNQVKYSITPFDAFSRYWLGFSLVNSGILFDLLLPFNFGFSIIARLSNFFGAMVVAGPIILYVAESSRFPSPVRKISSIFLNDVIKYFKLSPFIIFVLFLSLHPLFALTYKIFLAFTGVLAFVSAIYSKNWLMTLYSIAIISDFLKIMMVPYLPASRLTIIFSGFILIYSLISRIRDQEGIARRKGGAEVARQVAHDIRAPLAALNVAVQSISSVSGDQQRLVQSAVSRIRDIANDLLMKNDNSATASFVTDGIPKLVNRSSNMQSIHLISQIVEAIVLEMNIRYRDNKKIEIEAKLGYEAFGLFARVESVELKRVLSNLINNSVEALVDKSTGTIEVLLSCLSSEVCLLVRDNGKGIPLADLAKIGNAGYSQGKSIAGTGFGLGVYHAKKTIEAWNGSLVIESSENVGTTVTIKLPKVESLPWFLSEIQVIGDLQIAIIALDPSIHEIWKRRFLEVCKIEILSFFSIDHFNSWRSSENSKGNVLYLIDDEIYAAAKPEFDLNRLGVTPGQVVLLTSHFCVAPIEAREKYSHLKFLPKELIAFVPIKILREDIEFVLLENDPLCQKLWSLAAKKSGKTLRIFSSSMDFMKVLNSIDKSTKIYIDSDLGEERMGQDIAKTVFELGYTQIYLCTGFNPEMFKQMPWIKAVLGKQPPWL